MTTLWEDTFVGNFLESLKKLYVASERLNNNYRMQNCSQDNCWNSKKVSRSVHWPIISSNMKKSDWNSIEGEKRVWGGKSESYLDDYPTQNKLWLSLWIESQTSKKQYKQSFMSACQDRFVHITYTITKEPEHQDDMAAWVSRRNIWKSFIGII